MLYQYNNYNVIVPRPHNIHEKFKNGLFRIKAPST